MRTTTALALLITLLGCSKGGSTGETPEAAAASECAEAPIAPGADARRMFIECPPETRGVEMCTMDFNPVCGAHTDGRPSQTYPNKCAACKDPNVAGYSTGECDTGEVEARTAAPEQDDR